MTPMELTPVAKISASQAVFDQLFAELVSGSIGAGESLPAERALTESLQVNRQAVREALQRLAQVGLVRIRQGEPTRALDFTRSGGLDLLPQLLSDRDGAIDTEVARSVIEMRACIGPDVARLAALRAPEDIGDRLERCTAEMRAHHDPGVLARLDLGFWDLLVDAANNIAYRLAYNSLRATYEPLIDEVAPLMAEELADHAAHTALVGAVSRKDAPAAEAAARVLLAKGAAVVVTLLSSLEEGKDV